MAAQKTDDIVGKCFRKLVQAFKNRGAILGLIDVVSDAYQKGALGLGLFNMTVDLADELLEQIKPGMTELQVCGIVQHAIYMNGAEYEGMPQYVLSGPNSRHAISRPTHRVIEKGDLVQLNLSALVSGYSSGVGVPVCMGSMTPEMRDLIEFGLIPEFIGRLPVVVSLDRHKKGDLVRILTEPRNALVRQFQGLFALEGKRLEFTPDGLESVAEIAIERETGVRALRSILGEDPRMHTHVGIDYVPSLGDWKTAMDYVHFEGFLGARMSLQFTWTGSDSALAAPLVLDLARLTELSMQRGESGVMEHTASFFKDPMAGGTHDFHQQLQSLLAYVERTASRRRS